MLKIIHTGHAGFIFKIDDKILVCDHWSDNFFPFEGSWEKLEKDNFSQEVLEYLYNPDYIWCSHAHGDHFDEMYLSTIKSKAKLIIPDFIDKSFQKIIEKKKIKLDITCLSDNEKFYINDKAYLQIFFEEPIYTNHSSLFIKTKKYNIFHNADTTINDKFKNKIFQNNDLKKIDFLIGQYTNPTPYPWSIEMDLLKKEEEAIDMHNNALKSFLNIIRDLKPKYSLPCAGPAIVKKHNVDMFKKANKLIYDKESNLKYLEKNKFYNTKIQNIISGQIINCEN